MCFTTYFDTATTLNMLKQLKVSHLMLFTLLEIATGILLKTSDE